MPASRDENGRLTHAVFVGQDIDGDRKKSFSRGMHLNGRMNPEKQL